MKCTKSAGDPPTPNRKIQPPQAVNFSLHNTAAMLELRRRVAPRPGEEGESCHPLRRFFLRDRKKTGKIATMNSAPFGIIFDLDGTLADTLDDLTAALNVAVAPADVRPRSRDEVRAIVGGGLNRLMRDALGQAPEAHLAATKGRFLAYYAIHLLDRTHLYSGWEPALDALDRAGIPLAVLSNKPHAMTVAICDQLLSRWRLAGVQGEQEGMPLKPDPDSIRPLCDRMRLPPTRLIIVGDGTTDMELSQRTGMLGLGAAWGFRPEAVLREAGADAILHEPGILAALAPLADLSLPDERLWREHLLRALAP